MKTSRLPTYFLSHGGGPWPYMTGGFRSNFDKLEQSLIEMRAELQDLPKAVLVVSGHWEERGFAVSSGSNPGMVYDYNGFPDYLYQIKYGAPGSPELARHVQDLLHSAGIDARPDPTRGFDHGTFSLMKPLYPNEDIPVVQLSLDAGYDPALHLKVGRALAPLREEGVLIIGSGLSYHNLSAIQGTAGHGPSRQFDAWLQETLIRSPSETRTERLVEWEKAPAARAAHPREDHLIPLMVAVGAAEDEPGAVTYHQKDFAGGLTASSFRFGDVPSAPQSKGDAQ
ncbi:DODA-type extradiol aromatic ring-opening family dioxygenase [Rhizobium leguminosarum]|uniref:Dioxygenase n=1 Tax=Rhizobium leguminosarum TaxID=384 RepID=A0A2Z4YK02_RHILE|nr:MULTISPECIES: class III extradiol ring-cleavage dioxygenase [Rhizobium]MDH6659183.1 aromatic ring-opening dioxygenase catalytic subunit (LigB family) [Rhizobium sophorae]MVO96989.1 dioxygenase [Rhizobium leguminosarum bv. phaseoli]ASS53964.1 dioxygenase [Rhizobium leguminosarum bv. viciae]AVC48777.1 catalytic LigB subunit of aromatic ring-opening dioxygenase family protein [Rhizobium leguminosarum bv. viciae]AXA41767.1 Catalytic LigB subunit of aromatic ring-opening dioxygenase family prote